MVVISGVMSKVTLIITHIGGRITPLLTTHEPPGTNSTIQTLNLEPGTPPLHYLCFVVSLQKALDGFSHILLIDTEPGPWHDHDAACC